MKRVLLVITSLLVAACATPNSGMVGSVQPGQSANSIQSNAARARSAPYPSNISVANELGSQNDPAAGFDGIEVLEAPKVRQAPPEALPNVQPLEPAIVCERTVPTGSTIPVLVCRHKEDIARQREHDRRIFDEIKRQTALGAARL